MSVEDDIVMLRGQINAIRIFLSHREITRGSSFVSPREDIIYCQMCNAVIKPDISEELCVYLYSGIWHKENCILYMLRDIKEDIAWNKTLRDREYRLKEGKEDE